MYANHMKKLKVKSIIASPSVLGKDIHGDNLQRLTCHIDSLPSVLML